MIRNNKREKFYWSGMHPLFYDPFVAFFTPSDLSEKVVVDVGCGKGINTYIIKSTKYVYNSTFIGIDASKKNLNHCQKHNLFEKVILKRFPPLPFKDKSVDFLLCTEIIEHLTQKDGNYLLSEIDRVCRGRSIISTPNILYPNPPGGEEDIHRSYWSASSLKKRGYKVYGLGAKIFLDNKDRLFYLKQALYYFLTPISYVFPNIGGYLIGVKDYR